MLPTGFLPLLLLLLLLSAISWGSTIPFPIFRGRPPSMSSPPLVLAFLAATALSLFSLTFLVPVANAGCRLLMSRAVMDDFEDAKAPLELDPLLVSRVPAWKIPPPLPPPPAVPEEPFVPYWMTPPCLPGSWKPGTSILRPARSSHTSEHPQPALFRRSRLHWDSTVFTPRTKRCDRWVIPISRYDHWKFAVLPELEAFFKDNRKLRQLAARDHEGDVLME